MPRPPTDSGPYHFLLAGSAEGSELTFFLDGGRHEVGSARTAEVYLPFSGVSRRHARFLVECGELVVEDLGSTNGTWVGSQRVRRARVNAGAEVSFGPIRLRVEAVPAADGELAIELEPGTGAASEEGERTAISTLVFDDTAARASGEPTPPGPELVFPPGARPGTSPLMRALYERIRPLLRGELPVLVHGETGVGKELVARILHASSKRRGGPFVAINCAALPAELLEAEMFGIGRGVATGVDAREGRFQLAEGGTLFLDEVGEMAPALQAKLLRTLQEKEVTPLGGRPTKVDVWVISATNVDLDESMDEGRLRRDLFYRLAGYVLEVPPLRRAREDIPGLVEHFLVRFAAETGIRVRGLSVAALERLLAYDWPGNVRELEHEVRRLVYDSAGGRVITSDQLSGRLLGRASRPDPLELIVGELDSLELAPLVAAIEEGLVREALRRAGGKKIDACRLLGLSRNGLDNKLRRYGIEGRAPQEPEKPP